MTQIEPTDEDIAEALRAIGAAHFWTPDYARKLTSSHGADIDWWTATMILAHARTIAKLRVAREALGGIEIYGSDTLSGRVKPDPSTYREWLIGGVREMRNRARAALAQITQETPNAG